MRQLPYTGEERRDGVVALAYALGQLAALFVMCDRRDLGVALGDNGQGEARIERGLARLGLGGARDEPAPSDDYEPNVFLYDNYPGGIGLSEPLYRLHERLLQESLSLIRACPCADGCPSCVGPAGEVGSRGKEVAAALLRAMLDDGERGNGATEAQRAPREEKGRRELGGARHW
jgi:DEAD/DEAH box helicase domain-containing protein